MSRKARTGLSYVLKGREAEERGGRRRSKKGAFKVSFSSIYHAVKHKTLLLQAQLLFECGGLYILRACIKQTLRTGGPKASDALFVPTVPTMAAVNAFVPSKHCELDSTWQSQLKH